MLKLTIKCTIIIFLFKFSLSNCQVITGAQQLDIILPLLNNKNVALVVNQTSLVEGTHLLDTLIASKIRVSKIFAPEHGFRGVADAGEKINNSIDLKTKLPIVSLYGKNKKPTLAQLQDIDMVIFDIQDVGCRFYTYISTLHYVMEACAEYGIALIILDRPNPNGMYIDGPVLDTSFRSFVGMHPVPIVYGMTMGEYGLMIKGEKWINNGPNLNLKVVKCNQYQHATKYKLPVKPSPNLPNELSIALYPSLCLFEGTSVSVARGTTFPFQALGYPDSSCGDFSFTPQIIVGMSKEPMHLGKKCYGEDLRMLPISYEFTLKYIIEFYQKSIEKDTFFNNFFVKLIGNARIIQQIKQGKSELEIRNEWKNDLDRFRKTRKKYLLYPDF